MSYRFSNPLIVALTAAVPFSGAHAENWPQFRGPTHQGLSSERSAPLHWNATTNVAWKTEIPGEGWSSPIVWNDRVFVTTATDGGASCRVLSIDRASGKLVWVREVFRQQMKRKEGRNSYATPTPATDGERVYACFGDGSFAALNFDGSVAWTNREHEFYSQHGLGTSPILFRDLLIMARDGSSAGDDKQLGWQKPWDRSYVLALDAKTGKERWKGKRGLSRIAHCVPNVWVAPNGKAEVVSEAGDVVQGFDAETGERLWSYSVVGEGKVPSVVLGKDLVFAAGGWGGRETVKAFRLGARGDLQETQLAWEQAKGTPKIPSLLLVEPHLFAITDGGVATCMKAATGEIVWQERLGGNFSASPVACAGRVYLLSDDGETIVIDAAQKFHVLARNPLGEKCQASLAVSQGCIFLRTEKSLYCIREAGG